MSEPRCPRCRSKRDSVDGDTIEFKCGTWTRDGEIFQSNRCINIAIADRDTTGENDSDIPFDAENDLEPPEIDQW